jgi:hypothetical protein
MSCNYTDIPNVPNVSSSTYNLVGQGVEIGDGFNNTNNILNDCATAHAALAAPTKDLNGFTKS